MTISPLQYAARREFFKQGWAFWPVDVVRGDDDSYIEGMILFHDGIINYFRKIRKETTGSNP